MRERKVTITNEEVYNRIKNGQSQKSLADEFGVSHMRIHQIYAKEKSLREAMRDDLYVLCLRCSEYNFMLATLVYNGLHRGNRYSRNHYVAPVNTLEELFLLPLDDVARIRNMGVKSIEVVRRMKEYLETLKED